MKYLKKTSYLLLIVVLLGVQLIIPPIDVEAKTLGSIKKELADKEAEYSQNEEKHKLTEEEIASTKQKIADINKEKADIETSIGDLNNEIDQMNQDIADMNEEIKSIVSNYQLSQTGQSPYLEYIFTATDFTDFIYRMAIAEQLSQYNKDTIDEYNRLITEKENKKSELVDKQASLNKLQEELSVHFAALGDELASISEASIDIKDEIADLKQLIKLYEDTYKCSDNEEISACQTRYNQQHSSSGSGGSIGYLPSAAGFYRPVAAGRVNANYGYTAYYGSYHDGLDIGVSHGTPVYAVANGTVVKISQRSSCGGNMVYIAHRVNGATYTSGYFHLASINVSVGESVTHNSVIGYSGGVPSIEYWDGCSTGAHLHLQIATGLYMTDYYWYSNYKARSFDPRNVINFPAWGSYFSGR